MGIVIPGWQVEAWTAAANLSTHAVNVVVVGGGLSGCAAAVAAARRGARVLLLEPNHLLGGQMTVGGVGTVDLVPGFATTVEQGLWGEIAQRVREIYASLGLTTSVARYRTYDSMAVNAPIADQVLTGLCNAAGVEVVRNCTVTAAVVTNIAAVLSTSAGKVTASVAVDATEDGALIGMAGLPFRLANLKGVRNQVNGDPSQAAIQRITQCAVIRRYDDGIPDRLRMRVPPTDYALHRDFIAQRYPGKPYGITTSDNDFAGYRAYPDIADRIYYGAEDRTAIRRTSLNHGNEVTVHADFVLDESARRRAITEGINRSLGVIYYLQEECGLPWGIATDEGFSEGPSPRSEGVTPEMPDWVADFPVLPYLRESRRLLGSFVLTAHQIERPINNRPGTWSPRTLAVGTYPIDMHGSKKLGDFERDLGESAADVSSHVGPFAIPFAAFVPANHARLVVAEKNLSMSRLAAGAVRVHPSVTAVGEAAGTIAAMAWRKGIAPRSVSFHAVQVSLLRGRALLTPYPISSVPAGHPDYPAVALAVLNHDVAFTIDNTANQIAMSATELAAATDRGRRLVSRWEGPL